MQHPFPPGTLHLDSLHPIAFKHHPNTHTPSHSRWRQAGVWCRKPSGWRKCSSPPSSLSHPPLTLLINITDADSGGLASQSHFASWCVYHILGSTFFFSLAKLNFFILFLQRLRRSAGPPQSAVSFLLIRPTLRAGWCAPTCRSATVTDSRLWFSCMQGSGPAVMKAVVLRGKSGAQFSSGAF